MSKYDDLYVLASACVRGVTANPLLPIAGDGVADVIRYRDRWARCFLHPGSNLPPPKDMHGAVCTRSQTCTFVFLQPYRYYVRIAVARETIISSLSPDEADSLHRNSASTDKLCTDYDAANVSKYADPYVLASACVVSQ